MEPVFFDETTWVAAELVVWSISSLASLSWKHWDKLCSPAQFLSQDSDLFFPNANWFGIFILISRGYSHLNNCTWSKSFRLWSILIYFVSILFNSEAWISESSTEIAYQTATDENGKVYVYFVTRVFPMLCLQSCIVLWSSCTVRACKVILFLYRNSTSAAARSNRILPKFCNTE